MTSDAIASSFALNRKTKKFITDHVFFSEHEFQVVKAEQPIFCLPIDNNVSENQCLRKKVKERETQSLVLTRTRRKPHPSSTKILRK